MLQNHIMSGLHLVLLILSYLSLAVSLYLNIKVLQEKTSRCQMLISLLMVSIFVMNVGSCLELICNQSNTILTAVKLEYLGRIFIFILMAPFIQEFFHRKQNHIMNSIVFLCFACFYAIIMTTEWNHLFYQDYSLTTELGYPKLQKTPGVVYYIYLCVIFICYTYFLIIVYKYIVKDFLLKKKKQVHLLAIGVILPIVETIGYMSHKVRPFDLMSIVMVISGVLFYISMRKYHIFEFEQNVREFILDNAEEAVMITDLNRNLLYRNRTMEQMYPNLTVSTKIPSVFTEGLQNGKKEYAENDHFYELSLREINNFDVSGNGYLIEIVDVTSRKLDMMQINRLTEEASQANQKKSEFLANMSHEIRTPINAILGMDEMILREEKEKAILEYAYNIREAGERLLFLINDILEYSKMESGKIEMILDSYDSIALLRKVISDANHRKRNQKIQFHISVDPNIPQKLYGDETKLMHLLRLLILNGENYSQRECVRVNFSMERVNESYENYPKCFLVMECVESGRIVNDISDLGEKMILNTNSNIDLSMGLTEHLCNLLGLIPYYEARENGNRMIFRIPQGIVDHAPVGKVDLLKRMSSKEKHEVFEAPNAKVLVVDDNQINLKVIKGLMKRTKIQVVTVNSGMECLEKVQNEYFDIIFMDHLMPEMDGIQTLEKLRVLEGNLCQNTPVVALTANAISGAREMYMKCGFTDYLVKPIKVTDLEDVLKRFCNCSAGLRIYCADREKV